MKRLTVFLPGILVALASLPGTALAETHMKKGSDRAMIEDAIMAGPKSITDKATIKTMEGEVLRQGSNDWVCYPGPNLKQGRNAMCLDPVWEKLITAWKNRTDFSTDRIGISYMLGGDEGASNTDPFATTASPDNQWVVEGPHLMIAVPDPALLEGLPRDPKNGGPYVMWEDTPYMHVMVPLGGKVGAGK